MLKAYEEVERTLNDLKALEELCAEEPSLEAELSAETTKVIPLLEAFELRSMLSGSQDTSNAYIRVQAGAGGTEACDWAQMLVRMYTRWAETKGYKIELVDELRNESAGVRTATLYIIGQLMGQPDQFSPAIKSVFGICWPLLVFTILIRIWIFRYQMVKMRRAEQESGEQISNGKEKHS